MLLFESTNIVYHYFAMLCKRDISYSLIIVGGKAPESFAMPSGGYAKIVAADSGFDTALALNVKPDLIVGDFDSSINSEKIEDFPHIKAPKDKDESDMELALMNIKGGYDLLGGGEGRLDHLMAIFSLFNKYGLPRFWFTKEDVLIGVNSMLSMNLPIGSTISIFPLTSAFVKSKGLVWELGDKPLSSTFMSLSNRTRCEHVCIMTDAPILVRLDRDASLPNLVEYLL